MRAVKGKKGRRAITPDGGRVPPSDPPPGWRRKEGERGREKGGANPHF